MPSAWLHTLRNSPTAPRFDRKLPEEFTCARVCSSRTAWPQAALISSQDTGSAAVRPSRKPPMVPNAPACQMWNTSFHTLVRRSDSSCASATSICMTMRSNKSCFGVLA